MTGFDFPPDLLDLQRRFLDADARCQRISDSLPASTAIAAGEPVDWSELDQARAERRDLAGALQQHQWWENVEGADRSKAKMTLRAAAKAS